MAAPRAAHAAELIPFPAELQRDVDFWIRVYSEVTTSEGFLHDERDLSIVYRKLRFEQGVTPAARRTAVDAARKDIEKMLRRLASGAKDLSEEERRIAAVFGENATTAQYSAAARAVRFQLGQADRFREGLERAGIWEAHIARTFAKLGLPPELAALPHVESSFDPTAYSKVGAAGLWQFMPATGRRYMRVDDAVDERMDPFRATEAAAQLLDYNYRFLDSWPLALTAYNHGAAGMRRARDAMGTTDIATIVRKHRSASFGFASRNFYVSFLAALTIDRDPAKYFSNLQRRPEMTFTEVKMPAYVPLAALEKALGVDRDELVALNPAFRPALLQGRKYVPEGYLLRLPAAAEGITSTLVAQRVSLTDQYVNQPRSRSYRVRSGDTLGTVAKRQGMSVSALAKLNNLPESATLRANATLRLPDQPATRVAAAKVVGEATPPAVVVALAEPPSDKVSQTLTAQRAEARAVAPAPVPEPVTAAEARAEGPALAPGGAVAQATESIDYAIGDDNTIVVAAEETIGHFAQWLDVPASRVRSLNRLAAGSSVRLGRRLKLDFSKTTREQFDAKRREFHETLQASFYAGHRIVGTQVYVIRSGDSLWNVAQRNGALPTWLVLHYNPDIDFQALRAGQEVVIPRIEATPSA